MKSSLTYSSVHKQSLLFRNKISSKLYHQTYMKHSRSYQNNFTFDSISKPSLDKPTSLSLSGNNLTNLNNTNQQSPTNRNQWYIMTGDCILNLSKTNSEENPMVGVDMANFKTDKNALNKQKSRKLKEEKKKLINRVNNSNTRRNCVTNSDQMRECLSPEIKSTSVNKSEFEIINNTINDQLTDQLVDKEEKLLVITSESSGHFNEKSSIELANVQVEFDAEDMIKVNEELITESSELSNGINQSTKESINNENDAQIVNDPSNTLTAIKRFPTFIQQAIDYIENDEQMGNLCQKSIDEASAKRLAKRLFNLDKFRKIDVSRHLSKNNEFNKVVAFEYCNFFDFSNMSLIDSLRLFLSKFCLIGETQERERILCHFSKRFFTCNPTMFTSTDAIYTLTCSLLMLNQDLHSECVSSRSKMSLNEFIDNLRLFNNDENYSKELLRELYTKIKSEKLEWCDDDNELKDDSYSNNGSLSIVGSLQEISNSSGSIEYKRGFMMRKCCLRTNGKKVLFGKRKWKSFYAVLRDTILYLHKDDQGLSKSQIYNSVKNSIRIQHAVAFCANDYTKRKNTFRLCTADGSEYLFHTNSKKEMNSWIESINYLAACLSAPAPFSTSTVIVSEKEKKKYPLKTVLPINNTTKYQFKEQLNDHESRLLVINSEIQDITSQLRLNYNLVGKKAKNTVLQLKYLKHEYERYSTYCKVMKKVKQNPNGILEKASKNHLSTIKSKTLTTLVIGEEQLDDSTIDEQ